MATKGLVGFMKRNSATILTIVGSAGVAATAILAATETPKALRLIEEAKEKKVMIPMSNKTYDILKIVAIVILPLIQALYVGLSKIWGFGFGTEIDQTIQLIIAAINTILGVALVKSSSDYHKDK